MRDLYEELQRWDAHDSAVWSPEPGDILVGRVDNYSTRRSREGSVRILSVQDEATGRLVDVWLNSPSLLNLIKDRKPSVGQRLGIKYAGRHPEKDCELYVLIVDEESKIETERAGGEASRDVEDSRGPEASTDEMESEPVQITDEEKAFLAEKLGSEPPTVGVAVEEGGLSGSNVEAVLRDTIRRQEDEALRLARSVDRLEQMLSVAIPAPGRAAAQAYGDDPGAVRATAAADPAEAPIARGSAGRRRGVRPWILAAAIIASGALGVVAHFLRWMG